MNGIGNSFIATASADEKEDIEEEEDTSSFSFPSPFPFTSKDTISLFLDLTSLISSEFSFSLLRL